MASCSSAAWSFVLSSKTPSTPSDSSTVIEVTSHGAGSQPVSASFWRLRSLVSSTSSSSPTKV
jgi:hypothetical protein